MHVTFLNCGLFKIETQVWFLKETHQTKMKLTSQWQNFIKKLVIEIPQYVCCNMMDNLVILNKNTENCL